MLELKTPAGDPLFIPAHLVHAVAGGAKVAIVYLRHQAIPIHPDGVDAVVACLRSQEEESERDRTARPGIDPNSDQFRAKMRAYMDILTTEVWPRIAPYFMKDAAAHFPPPPTKPS